ncbi:MAG: competence protein ComEC family protein [Defluviitaleaceae bacterium]|nr:competence protein ComEC family protein [Defluviitaleaceae bacterium]
MNRPLFLSLIFLCFGILTGLFFSNIFYVFTFSILCICFVLYKSYKTKIVILFIVFYFVGYFGILQNITPKNLFLEELALDNNFFYINGVVQSISITNNGRERVNFLAKSFYTENYRIYERLLIQVILPHGESTEIGQNLLLYGNLLIPIDETLNGFNQFRFLRTRGIYYTIFPRKVDYIGQITNLNTILQSFRNRVLNVFDKNLPHDQASVLKSMIMGDRSDIEPEILEAFRVSGLYHILVVSGLHISIIMVSINSLLSKFFHKKISAIISLLIIILYAFMIGSVSVYRASIMAAVLVFSKIVDRDKDFITSISFSAILLLFYRPLFLFDLGFLLSFSSVFAIAIGQKPTENFLSYIFIKIRIKKMLSKNLITSIATTVCIFLVLSPIFSYYFNRIMTYSIITNIAVMFLGKILVIIGFLVGIFGVFFPVIASFFSGSIYFISSFYILVANFVYNMPFATIRTNTPHILVILIYYLLLIYFFVWFKKPKT